MRASRFRIPFASLERVGPDPESWLDYAPGFLVGDARLYDVLTETVEWRQPEVHMYDRLVKTPRLVGSVPRMRIR